MCGSEQETDLETETDLEMAHRHVRQGVGHINQQREIVAKLRATGQCTETALQLLATFEATQQQHAAHLARLEGRPQADEAEGDGSREPRSRGQPDRLAR